MNYELARELKEAGFPQKGGHYICADGSEYPYPYDEAAAYIPNLEELIEACGERFNFLRLVRNKWQATSTIWHEPSAKP
jgi:hypothetical protein